MNYIEMNPVVFYWLWCYSIGVEVMKDYYDVWEG